MPLRFLYFRDESGVLAVLRVPTKEAWDRIPFKELIKRAPGFVRGRGGREKEKKHLGYLGIFIWKLERRLVAANSTICSIGIKFHFKHSDTLPVLIGKDSDVNTVTRTSLLVRSPISSRDPRKMSSG